VGYTDFYKYPFTHPTTGGQRPNLHLAATFSTENIYIVFFKTH
jgi:hypothetical protein